MQPKIHWTARADACLRRWRARGVGWETIARHFGLNRYTVIRHGLAIGAVGPAPVPRPDPDLEDPAREPLGPGHPLAWTLLNEGTAVLARTRYPWPSVLEGEWLPHLSPAVPATRRRGGAAPISVFTAEDAEDAEECLAEDAA